ncbi:MAG: hypothetical protein DDT32_01653 [Syntrophomonadaceae bacterium]|nr:hypothetical protein [Bacillota bacterium]
MDNESHDITNECDTSPNRAYLAPAIAFAKIPLRRTSDTLGTLAEMPHLSGEVIWRP